MINTASDKSGILELFRPSRKIVQGIITGSRFSENRKVGKFIMVQKAEIEKRIARLEKKILESEVYLIERSDEYLVYSCGGMIITIPSETDLAGLLDRFIEVECEIGKLSNKKHRQTGGFWFKMAGITYNIEREFSEPVMKFQSQFRDYIAARIEKNNLEKALNMLDDFISHEADTATDQGICELIEKIKSDPNSLAASLLSEKNYEKGDGN